MDDKKNKGIDNLIPLNKKSKEEQRQIARNGGIKSGEVRRRKKTMKEAIELMLSLDVKDKKVRKTIESLGFNADEIDNQMAITVSMLNQSLKGNVQAATFIRDTVGDKPVDKVESNVNLESKKSAIDDVLSQMKSVDE